MTRSRADIILGCVLTALLALILGVLSYASVTLLDIKTQVTILAVKSDDGTIRMDKQDARIGNIEARQSDWMTSRDVDLRISAKLNEPKQKP